MDKKTITFVIQMKNMAKAVMQAFGSDMKGAAAQSKAASDAINKASGSAKGLSAAASAAGKATADAARAAKSANFKKPFDDGKASAKGFVATLSSLKAAFVAFAAAAVVTAGIRSYADFEKKISEFGAVAQDSMQRAGMSLDDVRKKAQEMVEGTVYGATDAAAAMTVFARAGADVPASMNAAKAAINGATVAGVNLDDMANIVISTLNQFGISANRASDAVDVLSKVDNISAADMRGLGEALSYSGTVANSAGVSFNTLAASLGVLGDAGTKGSRAGTEMQDVISRMLNVLPTAEKQLKRLGLAAKDLNPQDLAGTFKKLRDAGMTTKDALIIFGEQGGRAATVLANNIPKLEQYTEATKRAGGTAEAAAKQMQDNISGDFNKMVAGAKNLAIQIGESGVGKAFRQLLQLATQALTVIRDFIKWLNGGTGTAKTFKDMVFALAVGLSAGGLAALYMSGGLVALGVAMDTATASALAFTAALLTNPITWIAVAIAAAVAAVVYFGNKTYTVAGQIVSGWDIVMAALQAVAAFFVSIWDQIKEPISKFIDWFTSLPWLTILAVVTGPLGWMVALFVTQWDNIKAIFNNFITWLQGWTFEDALRSNVFGPFTQTVAFFVENWDKIKSIFDKAIKAITAWFAKMGVDIHTTSGVIVAALTLLLLPLITLKARFVYVCTFIATIWSNLGATIREVARGFASTLSDLAAGLWSVVKGDFSGAADHFKQAWQSAIGSVSSGFNLIGTAASAATSAAEKDAEGSVKFIKGMIDGVVTAGKAANNAFGSSIAGAGKGKKKPGATGTGGNTAFSPSTPLGGGDGEGDLGTGTGSGSGKASKLAKAATDGGNAYNLMLKQRRQYLRDLTKQQEDFDRTLAENQQYNDIDIQASQMMGYAKERYVATMNAAVQATRQFPLVADAGARAAKALGEQMDALRQSTQEYMSNWKNGALDALGQWMASARDVAGQTKDAVTNVLDSMSNTLTDFVTTGKLDFASFAKSVIAEISKIIVKLLLMKAIQAAGNAFGIPIPTFHTGGIVGQASAASKSVNPGVFAAAKRFHKGGVPGLGPDEVPIIAQTGERILSRADNKAFEAGMVVGNLRGNGRGSGSGGGSNSFNISSSNTFDFGGSSSSSGNMTEEDAKQASKSLQGEIDKSILRWAQEQSRPGGMLAKRA